MPVTRSIEELRDLTLQKIGRNVVNFQKMEAMLKFLLTFSDLHSPIDGIESQIAQRIALFEKTPMGRLVEKGADALYPEANTPIQPPTSEGAVSVSFSLEGGKAAARMWKSAMRAMVEERNRLIHQMLAGFDPRSTESCDRLCTELDAQRESILHSYAHLESLVSAIKASFSELAGVNKFNEQMGE
jgi:hypothetical protein